jgi:hypothetical protein
MAKNALENFAFSKETFEELLGETLTDTQWLGIAGEIDGRVNNYLDELLESLIIEVEEGHWQDWED